MLRWGASSLICPDVDAATRLLPGAAFTVLPLGDVPFRLDVVRCELGDMSVWIGRGSPCLAFGSSAPDWLHLLLPLEGQGRMTLHGRPVGEHDFAVGASGGMIDGASHGQGEWAVVMMPTVTARRLLLPEGRTPRLRSGQHHLCRADPVAWQGAASLLRSVREVLVDSPAVFDAQEPCRALRDSLLDALRELIAGSPETHPARILRTSELRRSVIARVEAFLAAHPHRAASLAALSEGVGIPAARLRAAFQTSFGLEPSAFLTLRRLSLARSALRSRDGAEQRAEAVAQAYGFDLFDDFARDYQRVFGEPI